MKATFLALSFAAFAAIAGSTGASALTPGQVAGASTDSGVTNVTWWGHDHYYHKPYYYRHHDYKPYYSRHYHKHDYYGGYRHCGWWCKHRWH